MVYVADMHCDTLSAIYEKRQKGMHTELLINDLQLDLQKMQSGNYLIQNFAVYVDLANGENPYLCYKNQLKIFHEEMQKNRQIIRQVKTYQDIEDNRSNGLLSALLTVEEGEICEGKLERLEELYTDGVRMMTFTWNYENSLGVPAAEVSLAGRTSGREYRGLTEMGIAFLEKMETLGIIADVSHLSPEGFYDVCRYSKKPFVASHSDAGTLCSHKRNLSDDMIREIAKRGGVIGVNYYGRFLEEESEGGTFFDSQAGMKKSDGPLSRVCRIADHILHMIHVGGIACVGLGSDFDGMDDNLEIKDCSRMGLLYDELKRRGLLESEIEGIFYQNVCTLYKERLG